MLAIPWNYRSVVSLTLYQLTINLSRQSPVGQLKVRDKFRTANPNFFHTSGDSRACAWAGRLHIFVLVEPTERQPTARAPHISYFIA